MSQHMLIAPDAPSVDRQWFVFRSYDRMRIVETMEVRWIYSTEPTEMDLAPPVREALLRRLRHPAWKITLAFWVDTRLGAIEPLLPDGYVMPGWIVGRKLESVRVCQVCRRREAPPDWHICRDCVWAVTGGSSG